MTIIIPAMSVDQQRYEISPLADHDTIIGKIWFLTDSVTVFPITRSKTAIDVLGSIVQQSKATTINEM